MKRTKKQESNIRKGVEKMKVSKEIELLNEAEWGVGEAFESGNFNLEEKKKLKKIQKELNDMWKERMENEK